MKKITIAALLIAICAALCSCSSSDDLSSSSDNSSSSSDGCDYYTPSLSEAEEGSNVKFNEVSDGGYTAWIEMRNIISLPDGEDGSYTASAVLVCLEDPQGKTLYASFPTGGMTSENSSVVYSSALENPPKLLEMQTDDGSKYVLMVNVSSPEDEFPDVKEKSATVTFYSCDTSVDEDGGQLAEYQINPNANGYKLSIDGAQAASKYNIAVSDDFKYVEGTTFADEKIGFKIDFEADGDKAEAVAD